MRANPEVNRGRWLLKDDYPKKITVYLIEGRHFEVGEELSAAVDAAIDKLVDKLFEVIADKPQDHDVSVDVSKPTRPTLRLDFSADGYMRLSRDDAEHFFPEDTLLALWRDESLVLLPTRGAAAGGLMLKQRNADGDRSLLIAEVFDFEMPTGTFTALWDESIGGLRVNLPMRNGTTEMRP